MIAKIGKTAARFLRDEDGAVTVDWVVLTAAIVGLGLVIGPTIGQSTVGLGNDIGERVASIEVPRYGYGPAASTGGGAGGGTGAAGDDGEGD
jgi:Flp pilus assembly pilin Flp